MKTKIALLISVLFIILGFYLNHPHRVIVTEVPSIPNQTILPTQIPVPTPAPIQSKPAIEPTPGIVFGATSVHEVSSIYPDPKITPGVANSDVTQANIQSTICVAGWTKTIRPGVAYTDYLKRNQIKKYGYTDTATATYEEDHFISLELGGHPTDPQNLWPESYETTINGQTIGAKEKDRVENELHKLVCSNQMTLKDAQTLIVTDWFFEYQKLGLDKQLFGSTQENNIDPDDI